MYQKNHTSTNHGTNSDEKGGIAASFSGAVEAAGVGRGKCLILRHERLGTRRASGSFLPYNTPSTLSGTSRPRYIAPNASYIISLELCNRPPHPHSPWHLRYEFRCCPACRHAAQRQPRNLPLTLPISTDIIDWPVPETNRYAHFMMSIRLLLRDFQGGFWQFLREFFLGWFY